MDFSVLFVETSVFTKQILSLVTDEELRALQCELIAQPDKGELIRGTGGLRKVRVGAGNKGKSSSIRVIYFIANAERIYFLLAYAKGAKETLTDAEKAELKKLVKQLEREIL